MGALGANPLIARAIQALGAGPAAGPAGAAPAGEEGAGASAMAAELHGAEPTFLLKGLQACKKQLSQYFVMSSQQLPDVAGNVAKAMTTLDRAIAAAQKAAATQSVVKAPVGFSLAGGNEGPTRPPMPGLGGF